MKKLILLLFLIPNLVMSEYLYDYKILRIIDGDTIEIEAPFFPKPIRAKISLRIKDIQAPEKRLGKKVKECEKKLGLKAALFTEKKINEGQKKLIKIEEARLDSFGRLLGDVIIDGVSLRDILIENKIVRYWKPGDEKIEWCN